MSTTETERPTIADLLRPFRIPEIVRETGVHRGTVWRWLQGAVPDEAHLPAIARVARVSVAAARRARIQTEARK